MSWILELAKMLGYAVVVSLVYVFGRAFAGINNSKATGFGVVSAQGYSLMMVGVFTVVLGFVFTRLDVVAGASGRPHLILK